MLSPACIRWQPTRSHWLISAHRLSAVRHANRITVVEKGKIVEAGPHDALIDKSQGQYAHLWKMQGGQASAGGAA